MLSEERVVPHLPLAKIWEWLVGVACRQTGHQRLKAIHLLLRIVRCCSHRSAAFQMGSFAGRYVVNMAPHTLPFLSVSGTIDEKKFLFECLLVHFLQGSAFIVLSRMCFLT